MAYLTQTDINVRSAKAACAVADMAAKVYTNSKYGLYCPEKEKCLTLLSALVDITDCYTAVTTDDDDGVINCITEAQLLDVFSILERKLNICFPRRTVSYTEIEDTNAATTTTIDDASDDPILDSSAIQVKE